MDSSHSPTLRKLLEHTKPLVAQQMAKQSFVDTAALAGGGGGGAPPGGDPAAAAGGGAPMDPAMMGGGGAPPPPAGGGGLDPMTLQPMIQQAVQMAMAGSGGGGGAGGAAGGIKPKIDVNVTMLQILKILARIADALGVQIPASEMVATQGDLTSFAGQQAAGQAAPAGGDAAGGAAAGGAPPAIPPIDPMQAATKSGADFGMAYPDMSSLEDMAAEASALKDILSILG